jgi:hypothetical protein
MRFSDSGGEICVSKASRKERRRRAKLDGCKTGQPLVTRPSLEEISRKKRSTWEEDENTTFAAKILCPSKACA